MKSGPIDHGHIQNDWLQVAKPAIEQRMQRYASTETAFALLTVRPTRSLILEQEISSLQERLQSLTISANPSEEGEVFELREQITVLQSRLNYELEQQERQRQENIRRRHNYIPFIMTLLRHLSRKGKLASMIQQAKSKMEANVGSKRKHST